MHMARQRGDGSVPVLEAPDEVIEYYNRDNKDGFDKVGYFMFEGVLVCAQGKKQQIIEKLQDLHTKEVMQLTKEIVSAHQPPVKNIFR